MGEGLSNPESVSPLRVDSDRISPSKEISSLIWTSWVRSTDPNTCAFDISDARNSGDSRRTPQSADFAIRRRRPSATKRVQTCQKRRKSRKFCSAFAFAAPTESCRDFQSTIICDDACAVARECHMVRLFTVSLEAGSFWVILRF
jgi:hypothetical protein